MRTLPLDFGLAPTRELQELLASHYYTQDQVVRLLRQTPLSPGDVDLGGAARQIWFHVLDTARKQDVIEPVLAAARQQTPALGERLDELIDRSLVAVPYTPTGAAGEPRDKPWAGPADVTGIERVLGELPTWLDIAFLARGARMATAVARLTVTFPQVEGYGTAFRIGPDLLLTNHHMLYDWEDGDRPVSDALAWFDWELDEQGKPKQIHQVACDPHSVRGDKEHDWAVIRTSAPLPDAYHTVALPAGGDPPKVGDRVFIVHHPGGDRKKISMVRNQVSYVDKEVIQYLTDTEQGSSGSPVFDDRWRVVGLHHRWVEVEEQRDGRKAVAYRNQARLAQQVRTGLQSMGVALK